MQIVQRELYPLATPLGDPREVVIPEDASVDGAVWLVLDKSGLQSSPP